MVNSASQFMCDCKLRTIATYVAFTPLILYHQDFIIPQHNSMKCWSQNAGVMQVLPSPKMPVDGL